LNEKSCARRRSIRRSFDIIDSLDDITERRLGMTATHSFAIALGLALVVQVAYAQDRSSYRDFRLGSNLSTIATVAKVAPSAAKTIHERPALIQELDWRPPYMMTGATGGQTDAVQRIVFTFYNDQLFKLVVSYDRRKTTGLTDGDMIEAISATYGEALLQSSPPHNLNIAGSEIDLELGSPIALWGDADYSVGLYRSSFASEFRVVVSSPRLAALAGVAGAEAIRLDEREAPQREADRKNKEAEDARVAREKARIANKATFKP
jgi:hypothetical protein